MFSDSFAGIAPASAPGFVIAQLIGATIGLLLHRALEPRLERAGSVQPPHRRDAHRG